MYDCVQQALAAFYSVELSARAKTINKLTFHREQGPVVLLPEGLVEQGTDSFHLESELSSDPHPVSVMLVNVMFAITASFQT